MTGESNSPQPGGNDSGKIALPDHTLLRRIATGSYGQVWLARSTHGELRAVKLVFRDSFQDARPYEREFSGMVKFEPVSREHDGLVDILQVGRNDEVGFFYYVMEIADNANAKSPPENESTPRFVTSTAENYEAATLTRLIRPRGRLPADEVLAFSIPLAEALAFLHDRALVHRDVKPSNIIFVRGRPKLADVGLVARMDDTISLVGTEGFIAPEGPGTAQADIYALGKVIYEAATGKDRHEFPELPTRLDSGAPDESLLELNEVILKACARDVRERYTSAGELLEDLKLIGGGISLRQINVRKRQARRAMIATALILTCACIAILAARFNSRPSTVGIRQPVLETIMSESFDGNDLNKTQWDSGYFGSPHPVKPGRVDYVVDQNGGEARLQVSADHEDGFTSSGTAWLQLKRNLKKMGNCRVVVDLAASVSPGGCLLAITDGSAPSNCCDQVVGEVQVANFSGDPREAMPFRFRRFVLDLLNGTDIAVTYADGVGNELENVFDLSKFNECFLRFRVFAQTSRGFRTASTELKVREITINRQPATKMVAGRVVDELTGWPVADVLINDQTGKTIAKTTASGAFYFALTTNRHEPIVLKNGYEPSVGMGRVVTGEARMQVVSIRKKHPGFGDIIQIIPCNGLELQCVGFVKGEPWVVSKRSGSLYDFVRVDLTLGKVSSGRTSLPVHSISAFQECDGRIYGFGVWPGTLFDLQASPPVELGKLTHPVDGVPLNWPWSSAYDGEFLWFVDRDGINDRFAIYALNLQTQKIAHVLRSSDRDLLGLAWDGDKFWVSSAKGRVYAVNRQAALHLGTVESGIGREFQGNFKGLAYGDGYLWGVQSDKPQICKIKIRD